MKDATALLRQVDAFCAKLNGGLAAVAVVLAVIVAAETTLRLPEILAAAPQLINVDNVSAFASDSY
jgi:hypothetical protein